MVDFPLRKAQEREQVYQLAEALQNMILQDQKLEDLENMDLFDIYMREKNVLDSIFMQGLKQVSLTCAERGSLLHELWKRKDLPINNAIKIIDDLQQSVAFEVETKDQILTEMTQHIAEIKQKYASREKRLLEHISVLEDRFADQEAIVQQLRAEFLQKEDNFLKVADEMRRAGTLMVDQSRKEVDARLKHRLHLEILRRHIEKLEK